MLATIEQADREYVRNVGYDNQNSAWILSDRDVWYANPSYVGPTVPHPEFADEYSDYDANLGRMMDSVWTNAVDLNDDIPY